MDSVERVARRTRELRQKHGLTQQELAELADMSEKFLQQIEACRKKEIWVSTVERIAAAFCLDVHEFLAPDLPSTSKLAKKVPSSRVHRR
ncbi:helix-turn-helix transcriptional regulator [Ruficoccus sp. ZRK36]|uniref:helix-turn-helix domain-containing protein n=1 Tax=Ruficoccus sp. ZRK36 TaxID=2866311 RepID=UPI001C734580|nr:helix-turn-helix transcriptional regulator [Ruficoccus sp. ZRK36]QYY36712.1 helix-turn-helix domain-containing protein [Ruficoccus sp. ZRK36]